MGTTADKLQAILDSKAAIKTAINNKGGSLTDSTPLDEYATAIGNIPTPILQSKTASPSTSQQTITPDGGYNGLSQVTIDAVTSSIDANIQAGNIKKDVVILGVTGTFEGGGGGSSDLDKLIDGTLTTLTSSVTSVRSYAFYYNSSLTSVNMQNVITLNNYAFNSCSSLASVTMPNATTLGNYVFQSCIGLTTIYLPSVTTIGLLSFGGCNNLQSAYLEELTSCGNTAFSGCSSLTTIVVPKLATTGTNTFLNCTSLTQVSINISHSVKDGTFKGCTSLQKVRFTNNSFGGFNSSTAFENCSSLNEIQIDATGSPVILSSAYSNFIPASANQHITIKVPSNLISSYQTASNWSYLYNQGWITFVAIS